MMHLTDGFGKKVPLSKVSIQQIMGRLPTKFRKITARTPTDAVSKMVDFFKKNKSDFESLVKEEVELVEKDIKILVKDVKDRNFLKDLLNKAKDEKVMVGSPTPADRKAGKYVFVGPKDKVNNVFNYAFDKSINRGNYAPATMMHEAASEMLDEVSRADANKINSELYIPVFFATQT